MPDGALDVLPIVRDVGAYSSYPYERCPAALQVALGAAWEFGPPALKLVECFLQVTGGKLTERCLRTKEFAQLVPRLVGAFWSPSFVQAAEAVRTRYVRILIAVADIGSGTHHPELALLQPRAPGCKELIAGLVTEFEGTQLDPVAVEVWRAWPVRNGLGQIRWLPLRPLYEKLGPAWTRALHAVLVTWFAGRRTANLPVFNEFASFCASQKHLSPELLQDKFFIASFWRQFWEYYKTEREGVATARVIVNQWRTPWTAFATVVLPDAGLLAKPAASFPGPQKDVGVKGAGTPSPRDEFGVLLLKVPIQLTDRSALEFILSAIPAALSVIRQWAETECRILYMHYRRRRRLARMGTVRALLSEGTSSVRNGQRWLVDRTNPQHITNAAATYEGHGHSVIVSENSRLYPQPLDQTAVELGLPTASSLLPFAMVLVLEHHLITTSFLETLELFDKNGKQTGLRKTDGGYYLIGYKYRKGERVGEQRVLLNRKSLRIVWQIVLITTAARRFLKNHSNDKWRRLFLTCGKGFGHPRVPHFADDTSMPDRCARLAEQIVHNCGVQKDYAKTLVSRLSLASVRATAGMQLLTECHSERTVSEALGHEVYQPSLLARYLPQPLLNFFRARWIRAFQLNLVIHVTNDSPYALRATGFKSLDELDEFMRNNALPLLKDALEDDGPYDRREAEQTGCFAFNANKETLTYLCRAANAFKTSPLKPAARYWGELGTHLLSYMDARHGLDPVLDGVVVTARKEAERPPMKEMFYG